VPARLSHKQCLSLDRTSSVTRCAAGERVCAWGRGEDGQLGLGSAEEKHAPTEVAALRGKKLTSVACGADHTTAFSDEEKTVWSWGWCVEPEAKRMTSRVVSRVASAMTGREALEKGWPNRPTGEMVPEKGGTPEVDTPRRSRAQRKPKQ